ncbi:MAG: elongation factor 1-beta [Nanoarchaeota archaeon]
MATVVIKIRILPDSPEANLDEIKTKSISLLKPEGAKNISFEEEPIAFGLKALILKTDMPEEKGTELVESILSKISHVSSLKIEDYRRAFG